MHIRDRAFRIAKAYTKCGHEKKVERGQLHERDRMWELVNLLDRFGRLVRRDALRTLGCQCGSYQSTAWLDYGNWKTHTWDCDIHGERVDRRYFMSKMNELKYLKRNWMQRLLAVFWPGSR